MENEDLQNHDNRPGFKLVSFGDCGLPLWRLQATVLCVRTSQRNVVEAFILRLLATGITAPDDIAGILGLSRDVVAAALSELMRNDEVRIAYGTGEPEAVLLTEKGRAASQEQVEHRPREEDVIFFLDGMTGIVVRPDERQVYLPRQARAAGVGVIRHFPLRPPEALEIDVAGFSNHSSRVQDFDPDQLRVLRVKSVNRSERCYRLSTALAFKSGHGNLAQVAFLLDGHLSHSHEQAFARHRGREKVEQFVDLLKPAEPPQPSEVCGEAAPLLDQSVRDAISEGGAALRAGGAEWTSGIVEVYRHPQLLHDALEGASQRLVIISPWIRSAVVSPAFLDRIEAALRRGVEVWIGHGLGEDKEASPSDVSTLRRLEGLSSRYSTMVCRRFGDTHSKVLIKDDDWYVITSFNWLSYRGDPKRPFREELGQLMHGKAHVDALWEKMERRFRLASESA